MRKPRPPGSLKQAVAQLVEALGGPQKVSDFAGVSPTQIGRYTDADSENAHVNMPVNLALSLEKILGEPVITRFLAREQGRVLVYLDPGERPVAGLGAGAAAMASDVSAFYGNLAAVLASGEELTPAKAGALIENCDSVATKVLELRRALRLKAQGVTDPHVAPFEAGD